MPQNRRQQGRPRRNSESTSLLLVVSETTAKPEIVSIHDKSPYRSPNAGTVQQSVSLRFGDYA